MSITTILEQDGSKIQIESASLDAHMETMRKLAGAVPTTQVVPQTVVQPASEPPAALPLPPPPDSPSPAPRARRAVGARTRTENRPLPHAIRINGAEKPNPHKKLYEFFHGVMEDLRNLDPSKFDDRVVTKAFYVGQVGQPAVKELIGKKVAVGNNLLNANLCMNGVMRHLLTAAQMMDVTLNFVQ